MSYKSSYTGAQIDAGVAAAQTAVQPNTRPTFAEVNISGGHYVRHAVIPNFATATQAIFSLTLPECGSAIIEISFGMKRWGTDNYRGFYSGYCDRSGGGGVTVTAGTKIGVDAITTSVSTGTVTFYLAGNSSSSLGSFTVRVSGGGCDTSGVDTALVYTALV